MPGTKRICTHNADNTPYAAIGIMRSKLRIFRLCDAETDPYPQNQAVEIIHDSAYSAYSFHVEYLYDSKGNLQFAFQTHADQTIRLYWKDSNLLRVMAADKTYDDPNSVPEHISDVAVGIKMAGESLQNLARQTLAKDVSYVTWAP